MKAITYLSAVAILVLGSSNVFAGKLGDAVKVPDSKVQNQKVEKAVEKAVESKVEKALEAQDAARTNKAPDVVAPGFFSGGNQPAESKPAAKPTLKNAPSAVSFGAADDLGHAPGTARPHSSRTSTADSDAKKAEYERKQAEATARAVALDKMDPIKELAALKRSEKPTITLSGAELTKIAELNRVFNDPAVKLTGNEKAALEMAISFTVKNSTGEAGRKTMEALPKTLEEIAAILKNAKSAEEREMLVKFFLGALPYYGGKGRLDLLMKKYAERANGNPDAWNGFVEYMMAAGNGLAAYAKTHQGSAYNPADTAATMRDAMKDWAQKRLHDNKVEDAEKVAKELCECTEACT